MASLLHDVGHALGLEANLRMRMGGCGIMNHEKIGEEFLAKLDFSTRVCTLVRSHVSAKRYLCYKNPDYFEKLSSASKTTLGYQGGPMSQEEAIAFESDPDFSNYLLMRSFDEAAKIPGLEVPSFASYFCVTPSTVFNSPSVSSAASKQPYVLSEVQLASFRSNSFLKVSNLLAYEGISASAVEKWTEDISSWPKAERKWLQHWEIGKGGDRILCRCENFVNFHSDMKELASERLLYCVSQLFGETAVLFKEKVNHKLPGGAGFSVVRNRYNRHYA